MAKASCCQMNNKCLLRIYQAIGRYSINFLFGIRMAPLFGMFIWLLAAALIWLLAEILSTFYTFWLLVWNSLHCLYYDISKIWNSCCCCSFWVGVLAVSSAADSKSASTLNKILRVLHHTHYTRYSDSFLREEKSTAETILSSWSQRVSPVECKHWNCPERMKRRTHKRWRNTFWIENR